MLMEEIVRAQETINAVVQSIRSHRPQHQQSPQGDSAQLDHVDEIAPPTEDGSIGETSGSTYSQEFHDASPIPHVNPLVIRRGSSDSLNSNSPRHLAAVEVASPRALTSPGMFPARPNPVQRTVSDEHLERSDSEVSDIIINTNAMTHHGYWARAAESTPTLLSKSPRRLRGRPVSYHPPSYRTLELSPRPRPISYRDSMASLDAPFDRVNSYREHSGRISHSQRNSILRDVYQMQEEPRLPEGYTPPSSSSGTEKPHRHSAVSVDLIEAANQIKNAGYVGQMRRISCSGETEDDTSSAPDAIEVGGHTYVRHGSGIDRENARRRRPLRKRRKGSPEGPDMGIGHEVLFFLLIATARK